MKFTNPEQVGYLQWLCNKYGDFKICTHNKDGTWTKHSSVMWCWEKIDEEGWRLDQANNRTPTPPETILDLDVKTPEEGLIRIKEIVDELRELNENFKVYFSGSKGYHIHIIDPELKKTNFQLLGKLLGTDIALLNYKNNHMIALEGAPHWKTGNKKVEVFL